MAESGFGGDVGEVLRETDLRVGPSDRSESLGRLPSGTIVLLKGRREAGFWLVEVELEDGALEGWLTENSVNRSGTPKVSQPPREASPNSPSNGVSADRDTGRKGQFRPRRKVRVPKDEGLLLRREKSFFYGLHARGNFNILETDTDDFYYLGLGFTVGAHLGFYWIRNLPLRLEAAYTISSGVAAENDVLLQIGFFDLSAQIQYPIINRLELFGGVQYSNGISINDIPTTINIAAPADLSSIYLFVGGGYRIPSGDFLDFIIRARYSISFLRAPIGIQSFGVGVSIEFSG